LDKLQFWTNFKLNEELHISGRFIYNGLHTLHEMEHLQYEDEVFEVLYNLSVGLERLMKVTVILIEHHDTANQEEFENSFVTHTHLDLLKRIRRAYSLNLAGLHNEFLQLLSVFYRTHRYGRYCTAGMQATGDEKEALHAYIEKHLNIKFRDETMIFVTENSPRIRKFLGKIVGKISGELYDVIRQEAARRNLYTYELRTDSKAAKIFLRKEYDFTKEDVLWRELLVFFVNSQETSGHLGFMKRLEPLEFDPGLDTDYLQCIASDEKKLQNIDELEYLYEGIDKPGERLKAISAIGNPSVLFDSIDEGDEVA
jgi:hypothetical protein